MYKYDIYTKRHGGNRMTTLDANDSETAAQCAVEAFDLVDGETIHVVRHNTYDESIRSELQSFTVKEQAPKILVAA